MEVGLFGREGRVPTGLVLGSDHTPLETAAQVEGTWLRIGTDALRRAMEQSPALHGLLMRHVQSFVLLWAKPPRRTGSTKPRSA